MHVCNVYNGSRLLLFLSLRVFSSSFCSFSLSFVVVAVVIDDDPVVLIQLIFIRLILFVESLHRSIFSLHPVFYFMLISFAILNYLSCCSSLVH